MCQVSCDKCQVPLFLHLMSHVLCKVLRVSCHMSLTPTAMDPPAANYAQLDGLQRPKIYFLVGLF